MHSEEQLSIVLSLSASIKPLAFFQMIYTLKLLEVLSFCSQYWFRLPSHTRNYLISAGCPTVQLSSDTVCLEMALEAHRWRLSPRPTRLPPPITSDTNWKSRLSPVLLTDWLTIDQIFQWPAPWVWLICQSSSQNSRETFYLLDHQFITKEYNSGMGLVAQW